MKKLTCLIFVLAAAPVSAALPLGKAMTVPGYFACSSEEWYNEASEHFDAEREQAFKKMFDGKKCFMLEKPVEVYVEGWCEPRLYWRGRECNKITMGGGFNFYVSDEGLTALKLSPSGAEKSAGAAAHANTREINSSDRAAGTGLAVSNPPSAKPGTLSSIATKCDLVNADGSEIAFAETVVPTTVQVDSDLLCGMADSIQRQYVVDTRAHLDSVICERTDTFVQNIGAGSYDRAIQKVSGWEQDGQTDAVLKIMKMCRNDASRSQAASDSVVAINFYSIGNFKQGDQTCLGLLVEISAQTSAKNKAYELKGAKACTSFSVDMERLNVFHPEVRPSGIPYGNVIVDTYAYSGMVPTRYTYKGSQYDFYSDEFKSKALSSVSTAQEGAYQAERSSSGRDLDKGSAPEQRYSDVGGPAISAIGESAIVKHQDEDPAATLPALLVSPAPVYPSRALSRGLDGSVTLEFTINPDGSTADPIVVESTSSLFERAASRAILKRRYESTVRKVTGVRDTVQFRLSN